MRSLFKKHAVDEQSRRDVVHVLHSNALNGMLVSVASISALAFGFDASDTQHIKTYFWAFMVSLLLIRFLDTMFWMKVLNNVKDDPRPAYVRFFIGVTLTALTWASYSIVLFPLMTILELATTMVVLSALAGGAAKTLACR